MIYHTQLGFLRSLVDTRKHKVRIKAWEAKEGGKKDRHVYRPAQTPNDARAVAGEAWGIPKRRWPEIDVRVATPQDIAVFARLEHVQEALRHPAGDTEQQRMFS